MNTTHGLVAAGWMLALVACSGATSTPETQGADPPSAGAADAKGGAPGGGTPSKSAPAPKPGTDAPATPDPNAAGAAGQPGRLSVDEHCCYGATYFRCPSTAACFGGFDIDACIDACVDLDDACLDACAAKEAAAGAPKGCQSLAPPAGVDCANGWIDL
jgi:hypothetical protein